MTSPPITCTLLMIWAQLVLTSPFFDFPGIDQGKFGKNSISRIGFRVPNDDALTYWAQRLADAGVVTDAIQTQFGAKVLPFYDFDQQRYQLVSDEHNVGLEGGTPYRQSQVPADMAISGLGPTIITVSEPERLGRLLVDVMGFTELDHQDGQVLYELTKVVMAPRSSLNAVLFYPMVSRAMVLSITWPFVPMILKAFVTGSNGCKTLACTIPVSLNASTSSLNTSALPQACYLKLRRTGLDSCKTKLTTKPVFT